MNLTSDSPTPITFQSMSILGLLSEYGPNLMQLNTSLTLAELHQFLEYRVETEILPKAEGPVADILHTVQRPASKERQNNIGSYQEKYLLKPKPLTESTEQGFMPSVTLLADRPLTYRPVPGISIPMGQSLVTASKEDDETIIIPSDGVGRLTGLENRENLYSKANADPETRRLRAALGRLRVPTLILFPKAGELSELHMQQAVYDMNVLATPLTSTMALNRDNRSPYNAVVKAMYSDSTANLKQFNLDLQSLIRFVKIALEGPKVAEKAGASGEADTTKIPEAATNLAFFWSVLTSSMAPDTLKIKDNMATGAPGITGLALVAHELFYGRAANWSAEEKSAAIAKLGAVDWSRTYVDSEGNVAVTETWSKMGILTLKTDNRSGKLKAVMNGAGATNSRMLTAYFLKVAGLEKPAEEDLESSVQVNTDELISA